jgi:hypothetical protein
VFWVWCVIGALIVTILRVAGYKKTATTFVVLCLSIATLPYLFLAVLVSMPSTDQHSHERRSQEVSSPPAPAPSTQASVIANSEHDVTAIVEREVLRSIKDRAAQNNPQYDEDISKVDLQLKLVHVGGTRWEGLLEMTSKEDGSKHVTKVEVTYDGRNALWQTGESRAIR